LLKSSEENVVAVAVVVVVDVAVVSQLADAYRISVWLTSSESSVFQKFLVQTSRSKSVKSE